MKENAAVLVAIGALTLAGCGKSHVQETRPAASVQTAAPSGETEPGADRSARPERFEIPAGQAPFDFGPVRVGNRAWCSIFPELDQQAARRNMDRFYVRAFAYTESGFDPNAAARVCSSNAIAANHAMGCFPADLSGNSQGYNAGFDEMHDPSGAARIASAPNSGSANPDWRWLGLGLMQTIEPPFTFWPASYSPDRADGRYFDVFRRSGSYPLDLNLARDCNARFNPFNPGDSACLGTGKMRAMLDRAFAWINTHRGMLNWSPLDRNKDAAFAGYIAGNIYDGVWESRERSPNHPRCSTSTTNGDCWAHGFTGSWSVTAEYCGSQDGQQDEERCSAGRPRREPPYRCYGYTDFVQYVRDCEAPFLVRASDPGRLKMQAYYMLRDSGP